MEHQKGVGPSKGTTTYTSTLLTRHSHCSQSLVHHARTCFSPRRQGPAASLHPACLIVTAPAYSVHKIAIVHKGAGVPTKVPAAVAAY